ncbi:hypothetical protein NKH18_20650 [Streptomyces sp. M10(2022)]
MDQEEAARAYAYAAKGRDITHTELQALNELLHDNSNNKSPDFAKAFYEKLGPDKSLTFFGQLATSTYQSGELDKQRLKDVQALQKNMGLTLAKASESNDFTAKWGPELRRLGTEHIPLARNDHGGPYGYQLLGGIMRFGNYDAKFLNPIAEHVAQLHQKDRACSPTNRRRETSSRAHSTLWRHRRRARSSRFHARSVGEQPGCGQTLLLRYSNRVQRGRHEGRSR